MLTKLSQWVTIWFCSLLHLFLSKSHDPRCSVKPKMCSLFDKSFRTIAYVITPHQVHLSQTTKHWNSFVSHCSCRIGGGKERNYFLIILQDFLQLNSLWAWYNYRTVSQTFTWVSSTSPLVCFTLSMCYFAQGNISWPFQPLFSVSRQLILP